MNYEDVHLIAPDGEKVCIRDLDKPGLSMRYRPPELKKLRKELRAKGRAYKRGHRDYERRKKKKRAEQKKRIKAKAKIRRSIEEAGEVFSVPEENVAEIMAEMSEDPFGGRIFEIFTTEEAEARMSAIEKGANIAHAFAEVPQVELNEEELKEQVFTNMSDRFSTIRKNVFGSGVNGREEILQKVPDSLYLRLPDADGEVDLSRAVVLDKRGFEIAPFDMVLYFGSALLDVEFDAEGMVKKMDWNADRVFEKVCFSIEEYGLVSLKEVQAVVPFSAAAFRSMFDKDSLLGRALRKLLEMSRQGRKLEIRRMMEESGKASDRQFLYKLFADDEEREKVNGGRNKLKHEGKVVVEYVDATGKGMNVLDITDAVEVGDE